MLTQLFEGRFKFICRQVNSAFAFKEYLLKVKPSYKRTLTWWKLEVNLKPLHLSDKDKTKLTNQEL